MDTVTQPTVALNTSSREVETSLDTKISGPLPSNPSVDVIKEDDEAPKKSPEDTSALLKQVAAGLGIDPPQSGQTQTSESINKVAYEWLKDVSSRLAALEGSKSDQDKKKVEDNTPKLDFFVTKPKVRDCNWEQFKNRYSAEDCTFAIETLLAGDDLDGEMVEEQLRRVSSNKRKDFLDEKRQPPRRRPRSNTKIDKQRIERIRINSRAILSFLARIVGEPSWAEKPHTFLYPFPLLTYLHNKIEEEFLTLEETTQSHAGQGAEIPTPVEKARDRSNSGYGDEERATRQASDPPDTSDSVIPGKSTGEDGHGIGQDGTPNVQSISKADYEEIKCYMEFARARIMPIYRKFENLDYEQDPKIRYSDVWCLFRPGELVFRRDEVKGDFIANVQSGRMAKDENPSQTLWRIHCITPPTVDWVVDDPNAEGSDPRGMIAVETTSMMLSVHRIDFDGRSFTGVFETWTLHKEDMEKEASKMIFYPVRFQKDAVGIIEQLRERGKMFRNLILHNDLAVGHDGWTLTHDPCGERLLDLEGNGLPAEYIDSEVIVDFHEAFQVHPNWKPSYVTSTDYKFEPKTAHDQFTSIQWSSTDRGLIINNMREIVVTDDDVGTLIWNDIASKNDLLAENYYRSVEIVAAKQIFSEGDFALLPSRVFAYSLRQRKFINADIRNIKPLRILSDPFNDLKIPVYHKQLVRSVVQDHFDKKAIQRQLKSQNQDVIDQDFIRGKGKGLVILLHGSPGVGKTATAEAVACSHRKPLFPITCGDLGTEPRSVERNLSEIFRLANLWDCVLLLDEAEIFLSRREKKDEDLIRNVLVSIFLRTLEYYPGILFLTTNRVGVLDEALNSRVHISLYFRDLTLKQTHALFKMNLKRSHEIAQQRAQGTGQPLLRIKDEEILAFAERQHNAHAGRNPWWNGRQIRNAFQIATSLAYTERKSDQDDSGQCLGLEHFVQVSEALENYDKYRQAIFHKTDYEIAAGREERSSEHLDRSSQRDSRRYDTGQDHSRPWSFQHHSSYPSASRLTPERQHGYEYPRHDDRAFTPTPYRGELSSSPMHPGQTHGFTKQPSPHINLNPHEDEDYE